MKRFYTVDEAATELRATAESVTQWIQSGRLLATRSGADDDYRVPAQALVVFKQNEGSSEGTQLVLPSPPPTLSFDSASALYRELIEPRLVELGVESVVELIERATQQPALSEDARRLGPLYDLYQQQLHAEGGSGIADEKEAG